MFGRRPDSNQAKICVSGFSAIGWSWPKTLPDMTNNCIGLHRAGSGWRDVYIIHPAPRIFNESIILWTHQARICLKV